MFSQDDYVIKQVTRDAYDGAFREAENLRKLRRAGLVQPGRVSRLACHGAGCLGRALVALGKRLERLEPTARTAPAYSAAD